MTSGENIWYLAWMVDAQFLRRDEEMCSGYANVDHQDHQPLEYGIDIRHTTISHACNAVGYRPELGVVDP